MAKAGTINEAFGWCDKNSITNLTVMGSVNGDDIKQIAAMSALDDVDISAVTLSGGTIADRAFVNAHIRSIVMPSSLTGVGSSLFSNCNRLAAIVWNANMVIPEAMMNGISNPNLLLYVSVKSYAPSSVKNVVVNGNAESIVLSDAASNDFYAPIAFTAQKINYTHNYSMQTVKGKCQGWETLTLPFTASKVSHSTKGEIVPFANNSTTAKPFWLYEITISGYRSAERVEAYKPYIISMPNNSNYADDYILAGDVTFSADNAVIAATKVEKVEYNTTSGVHTYVPCYDNKAATSDIYPLNVNQSYSGYVEGSVFYTGLRPVKPFEVFMTTSGTDAKVAISVFDDAVMGIDDVQTVSSFRIWSENRKLYIYTPQNKNMKIYSVSGQLVDVHSLHDGINIIDYLVTGVYIVNGYKILIE